MDSEQRAFAEQTNYNVISDYLRESKTVLESGFHVVGLRNLYFLLGFRIPWAAFQISKPRGPFLESLDNQRAR